MIPGTLLVFLALSFVQCSPVDTQQDDVAPLRAKHAKPKWSCANFLEERHEEIETDYQTVSQVIDCSGKSKDCLVPASAQVHVLFPGSIELDNGDPVAFDLATLYGNAFNYGVYTAAKKDLVVEAGKSGSFRTRAKQTKIYGTFEKCCQGFWSNCAEKKGILTVYHKSVAPNMEYELQ